MWKFLFWLVLWLPALYALWQLPQDYPVLSPLGSGLILLATGVLVGMRIGSDSATRFVKDLYRMNKFLAEMNADLAHHNHEMLKSMLAQEDTGEEAAR